jgi:hypothetical protein
VKNSLIEQAKAIHVHSGRTKKISKNDEELAAAWVNDEVTFTQVMKVKKHSGGTVTYAFLALALKQMLNTTNGFKK